MKLSENFDLQEMTKSQLAIRKGLRNEPNAKQRASLQALVTTVLQPVRDAVGPLIVNSGFRSLAVNLAVGGNPSSQHTKGEAADIEAVDIDNLELARFIATSSYPFDQLILECYTRGDPRSGWVHVSHNAKKNRCEVLTASLERGIMVYREGLHA